MTRLLTYTFVGSSCLCLATVSVLAQQSAGPEITLDVGQRFSTNSNQTLDPTTPARTVRSATRLTFGILTETQTSSLRFQLGNTLNFTKDSTGSDSFEAEPLSPDLRLSYSHETANSNFTSNLRYREDEVSFLRPLDDFLNEDGVLELPTDADDLNGIGTRINENYAAELDLFTDAPLSLSFNTSYNLLRYSGTNSASLFRTETVNFGSTIRARVSETTSANVTVSHRTFKSEDANNTNRETSSFRIGLSTQASPVLTLNASIGRTEVETKTNSSVETVRGTNGTLGATLDRPNGTISLSYSTTTNQNGDRDSLSLDRSFVLSDFATLDTGIGITRNGSNDWEGTGRAIYRQELPRGELSINLQRSVQDTDDENDGNISSLLSASYNHTINDWASVGFNVSVSDQNGVERKFARATYRHDLAQEWRLETGYQFSSRQQTNIDRADDHGVFLSVNRRFNLRP